MNLCDLSTMCIVPYHLDTCMGISLSFLVCTHSSVYTKVRNSRCMQYYMLKRCTQNYVIFVIHQEKVAVVFSITLGLLVLSRNVRVSINKHITNLIPE